MTLENIELSTENKMKIKIISAKKDIPMKDLVLNKAKEIIDNNEMVPVVEREKTRSPLIVDITPEFKKEIKDYCKTTDVRIRDFWVECVNQIIEEE